MEPEGAGILRGILVLVFLYLEGAVVRFGRTGTETAVNDLPMMLTLTRLRFLMTIRMQNESEQKAFRLVICDSVFDQAPLEHSTKPLPDFHYLIFLA